MSGVSLCTRHRVKHPLPPWMMSRGGRLWAAVVEATLDAHGHAGVLRRLRHPGFVARLAALSAVPPEATLAAVAPLLHRALKHDQERLDFAVTPDRVLLKDGRFAPVMAPTPAPAGTIAVLGAPSKAFERADPQSDDARLSAAFDLPFLPLPAPFLDVARRPRTGARVVTALALCSEVIFAPLSPADPLANLRAARAFSNADGTGVFLNIFDATLRQLEALLYRSHTTAQRVVPLQTLATMLDEGAKAKRGVAAKALARRDQNAAKVFGARSLAERKGPTIFRRPVRRVERRLETWTAVLPKTARDQGDLFAW